ncbi:uncharacterized protein ANIA_11404 [Aspergillus nidulans FGSC A4]|uniref:Uncharacterized protein n=1 Tax=Emericella nidulans (strain FGSC A4 / ATCC 38163 / CBS 112.46 / NRRL 194 / M139) TaxID=227321 RepID=C8V4F8_EMENI|nr:hypothetical protein [Aspergillus nidulans FGSC A4]CBF75860.1 TPA: hypothetical protein ANIA_11404 [Aspergillus nidulans FGSC A4]
MWDECTYLVDWLLKTRVRIASFSLPEGRNHASLRDPFAPELIQPYALNSGATTFCSSIRLYEGVSWPEYEEAEDLYA